MIIEKSYIRTKQDIPRNGARKENDLHRKLNKGLIQKREESNETRWAQRPKYFDNNNKNMNNNRQYFEKRITQKLKQKRILV